jgi:hypothetical protein
MFTGLVVETSWEGSFFLKWKVFALLVNCHALLTLSLYAFPCCIFQSATGAKVLSESSVDLDILNEMLSKALNFIYFIFSTSKLGASGSPL